MKVLLTGATGFLGSHLLDAFLENGYKVSITKRRHSNTERIDDKLNLVKVFEVDSYQELEPVFSKNDYDAVVHTACNYGRRSESILDIVDANLFFGLRLFELAALSRVPVFFNTDSALERNTSAYSLSKSNFVDWLKLDQKGLQVVNLRLEHFYGLRDDDKKFLHWLLSQLKSNVPRISLTSGEQIRDFIHVSDVVEAFMAVIRGIEPRPNHFVELHVGSGRMMAVRELVELVKSTYLEINPKCTSELGFGDVSSRAHEHSVNEVGLEPILKLGWTPKVRIEDGIEELVRSFN